MAFCPNMMTKEIWGYPMCRQRLMAKVKRSPMILICCIELMWLWFNFCTPEPGWLLEMNVFPIGTARPPIPIFPGPYIYIMFDTFKKFIGKTRNTENPKRLISNSDKWNGKCYFRHLSNRIQPQHVHLQTDMLAWNMFVCVCISESIIIIIKHKTHLGTCVLTDNKHIFIDDVITLNLPRPSFSTQRDEKVLCFWLIGIFQTHSYEPRFSLQGKLVLVWICLNSCLTY